MVDSAFLAVVALGAITVLVAVAQRLWANRERIKIKIRKH